MMDLRYTVTPVEGKDAIGYQLTGPSIDGAREVLGTRIAQLGDQIVRAQLIATGWTPPGEPTAIERKDALLRQCLEAFETDDWMKKLQAAIDIRKELSQ